MVSSVVNGLINWVDKLTETDTTIAQTKRILHKAAEQNVLLHFDMITSEVLFQSTLMIK